MSTVVIHVSFADKTAVSVTASRETSREIEGFSTAELLFGYDENRAKRDLKCIDENASIIEATSGRTDDIRRNAFMRRPTAAFLERVEHQREGLMDEPLRVICERIMLSKREHWSIMAVTYTSLVLEFVARLHQAGIYRQHIDAAGRKA